MTFLCLKLLSQCNGNYDYDVSHCANQSWTYDVDYDAISWFSPPRPPAEPPANVEHSSVLFSNLINWWISTCILILRSFHLWCELKNNLGKAFSSLLPLEILEPDVLISSFGGVWGDEAKIFKVSCQCWKALGTHSNSRTPAKERGFHSIPLLCTEQNKISNTITFVGVKGLTSQGLKTQAQFLPSLFSRKGTLDRE